MLIIGGIIVIGGALLFYPDIFSNILPPGSGFSPGGEFIDGGTVTPGGEFLVEDTVNPTGECKSKYNGKCKSECATDKYSARCQDCIALCGGGQGQPPGQCYSVGKDKSVKCGSTSNSCNTTPNGLQCKCGSNVPSNRVKNDRPFIMGGRRDCSHCVTYCRTGKVPALPSTPAPSVPGGGTTKAGTTSGARAKVTIPPKRLNVSASGGAKAGAGAKTKTQTITSTLCKCGSGRAKHVLGDCSACRRICSRTCGLCSPQCMGTHTNVGYFFEDAAESFFDDGTRFANMAFAV